MNMEKLKQAEAKFLLLYPNGFQNPEIEAIAQKHKMDKMIAQAQAYFTPDAFETPSLIAERMIKMVSQSSLVSVFEKPKFKDAVLAMSENELAALANGLQNVLYGDEAQGFEALIAVLSPYGVAKWPILTVIQTYFNPTVDLLIKPTTVKSIIDIFELAPLQYTSKPNYGFYAAYRSLINEMKSYLDPSLSSSNAAFCGFLMMSMEGL